MKSVAVRGRALRGRHAINTRVIMKEATTLLILLHGSIIAVWAAHEAERDRFRPASYVVRLSKRALQWAATYWKGSRQPHVTSVSTAYIVDGVLCRRHGLQRGYNRRDSGHFGLTYTVEIHTHQIHLSRTRIWLNPAVLSS